MKKIVFAVFAAVFFAAFLNAQSDDDFFSDDSYFSSDDDLFGGDDDFFADDGIDVLDDVTAKSDLSKGVLFDTGSIKIGGSLTSGISTETILYSPENTDFGDNVHNTKITPDLSAMLSVDARPTQVLRIYTKFGLAYPFVNYANSYTYLSNFSMVPTDIKLKTVTSISDWFKLKELFTDFSMNDVAFFRFGVHTVTWGAGYFFSPVSDMINSSSIDPEDPDNQVDGSLNLRTQIVFPNSQNCLWFYVIPSTDFINQTAESYARKTALAGKFEFLLGGWEFGLGGFWKYQNAPKAMLTATGSLKKVSFFGEAVYSYGGADEWATNSDWDDKTNIFQLTAGFSYYWKDPKINIAAQYYFNGNDVDFPQKNILYGSNAAAMISFGELFGNSDFSATIFAMSNFGRKDLTDENKATLTAAAQISDMSDSELNEMLESLSGTSLMINALVYYSPIKDFKIGMGPAFVFKDFESNPKVSFKISATLGGGKF